MANHPVRQGPDTTPGAVRSPPMRILYVSGSYVPSRRASSIHVMRMCSALASLGHQVTLVTKGCRARQEPGVDDPFSYYGVTPSFSVRPVPRPLSPGGSLRYLWGVGRLVADEPAYDLYFCRDATAAWRIARRGGKVLYEGHAPPTRWTRGALGRLLASRELCRLVLISNALDELFRRAGLVPRHADVVVAHDAADPIPLPPPVRDSGAAVRVGYVGHLYAGRGIELMLALAARRPELELHLVGGSETDIARRRDGAPPPNVVFHGFVPPARLAQLYADLDVLLMPYQESVAVAGGSSDTSRWMSPLKMFEYMATGRPIISSDLPVLREVLEDGRNALLVPPADLDAWDRALQRLVAEPPLARRLGEAAREEFLREHTWQARARRVLDGL